MSSLYIVKPESYCSGAGFIVYKLGGALDQPWLAQTSPRQLGHTSDLSTVSEERSSAECFCVCLAVCGCFY